jgi:class I lanthipeptide synthase
VSVLDERRRADAIALARTLIERVTPVALEAQRFAVPVEGDFSIPIDAGSFSFGGLGVLLALHAARGFPEFAGLGLQPALGSAAAAAPKAACTFDGYGGLFAALRYLAGDSGDYRGARTSIGNSLAASIRSAVADRTVSLAMDRSVDLVRGIAGVVLALAGDDSGAEACRVAHAHLLDVVDELRRRLRAGELSGPEEALNLGVSHGIGGVLAALLSAPDRDARTLAAIHALTEILLDDVIATPHGPAWPNMRASHTPSRAAWCYGAPGLACVMLEAAAVLDEASIAETAVQSVERIAAIDFAAWQCVDYGICHGVAGLALCVTSCSAYTKGESLRAFAASLVDRLVAGFDERLPYGYRSVMPLATIKLADDPGLLSGSAGIALTLLTLAGCADASWTRPFGIRLETRRGPHNLSFS